MTTIDHSPPGSAGADAGAGARPDHISPDGEVLRHPRGNCAGRRNASAFGTGRPNGASSRSFSLTEWEPRYKLVAPEPKRSPAARNHFAALYRALLTAGRLSENAHSFLAVLLDESNANAKSVHRQIWWIADTLGWGTTKVKQARRECEDLGLLVHHNRRGETDQGVRMRANRYGFTWTLDVISLVGFDEKFMLKQCGAPDLVYLDKVRRDMRSELREAAVLSGRAQAERGIALRLVEEFIEESQSFAEADRKVRSRFAGNPELENFAVDHLEVQWPRHQATIEGMKMAMLDVSQYDKEMHLQQIYAPRPDLLESAMGPISIHKRE